MSLKEHIDPRKIIHYILLAMLCWAFFCHLISGLRAVGVDNYLMGRPPTKPTGEALINTDKFLSKLGEKYELAITDSCAVINKTGCPGTAKFFRFLLGMS